MYYFNHNKVFEGGTRSFSTFPLDETALFLKANSIIATQDELLIVAVEAGTYYNKTIIYGSYSDDVSLSYDGQSMTVQVLRYYVDGRSLSN